jgi:hypothetical protein
MKSISHLLSMFLQPPDLRHDFQFSFWCEGDEVRALVVPKEKQIFYCYGSLQLCLNKQQLEACPLLQNSSFYGTIVFL